MCYYKSFWLSCKFPENVTNGECRHFLNGRHKQMIDLPYIFVIIAIKHNSNLTGDLRTVTDPALKNKTYKIENIFPNKFKKVLQMCSTYLY